MKEALITPNEAAQLKGVTRTAIYAAIADGRLPHMRVLGHIALEKEDVLAWTPRAYAGRPGSQGKGRAPGTALDEETKTRISQAQKRRWSQRQQEHKKANPTSEPES